LKNHKKREKNTAVVRKSPTKPVIIPAEIEFNQQQTALFRSGSSGENLSQLDKSQKTKTFFKLIKEVYKSEGLAGL
jgi:hypothetical protein